MHSIGVDIGGSHITACIYDHTSKSIATDSLIYRKVNSRGSKNEIIEAWASAIDSCRKKVDVKVEGVGVAMPGPFDYYNGISIIENVDKLSALYKVDIRTELARHLKIDPSKIRFINDATAFSIAEAMIGCARDYRRVVAITLGTGLGASFLASGKPIIEDDRGPKGGFLYNQLYKGKVADELFSTRGILRVYKERTGKSVTNVRRISELAREDEFAQNTMDQFGKDLGLFLAPFLNKFNAEVLVLGGNISKAYPYFESSLSKQLPQINIEISEFGEQSAVIGSAILLDDHYYKEITPIIKLM